MRAHGLSLLLLAAGCSGADGAPVEPPPVSAVEPDDTPTPATIEWETCDLRPGTGAGGAECAFVDVPRDHADPEGPTVRLAVKRVRPASPKTQVWIVDGGPGSSALNSFAPFARSMLDRPDVAVYAVDHRGTGGSNPLDCPAQTAASSPQGVALTDAEWDACIATLKEREGETLNHVTTSASMRDLALLVDRMREPGARVVVYGGSYGTYAVLRYVKLFPEQPDAIILEGISPPGRDFDPYDREMNEAARRLVDACANTPTCAARFPGHPWDVAAELVASFDQGHCPTLGLDADGARAFLGSQLFYFPIRDYIPVLVHRMTRCEPKDIAAVVRFYQTVSGLRGPQAFHDGLTNQALFFHVALSEMWHRTGSLPPPADVLAAFREGVMSTGLTVRLANMQSRWPVYPRGPEVDDTLPAFDKPILMLQGGLDAATAVGPARRLRDAYRAPGQTWVEFPTGAHQIVEGTPMTSGGDCGRHVLFQFLDDPRATIDTSCIAEVVPLLFDGTPALNMTLLGVTDAWDG